MSRLVLTFLALALTATDALSQEARPADATLLGEAADLNLALQDAPDNGIASAAAGWYRRLAALDAGERFEMLHEWSMPTPSRRTVRVLTSITPTDAPPTAFARALGERIRRDSFAVPEIAEVRGLFCSAWELVKAADEAGRLRQLTVELSKLAEDDVPNADLALTLAKIVGARREDDALLDELQGYATALPSQAGELRFTALSSADVVVAVASLTQEWLRPVGESILKTKLEQTYGSESPRVRPFLRYARATAIQKRFEDAADPFTDSKLAMWLPSSTKRAWPSPQGSVRPAWLSHQDHILHAFGPRNDYLLFRYPLTGNFEFSCETQIGGSGGTDGCVTYGGLGYEVLAAGGLARIWDSSLQKLAEFECPFVASSAIPTFNRFSLKSSEREVTFSANGHPIWRDTSPRGTSPWGTGPWIGLRSGGDCAPIFRNFQITGSPVIPREVKMSGGDSLRGWVTDYYDESTPGPATGDWSANGGTIHGAMRPAVNGVVSQSWMYYLRPLQNGESISYEFEYKPNEIEVHPSLGRIAFLIEPDGVRLHWMTDGDLEWTGLTEDNAVVEPLNRRGPKPLPLLPGEWNRVTVALARDTLSLTLNDTQVYSRKIEPEEERTFGFYHDKNRLTARIRNVVLRGDWPEQLTPDQLNNLAASSIPDRSKTDRRVLGAIFDDRHIFGSVLDVCHRAQAMPAEQRHKFLSDWVLPGDDHDTLRLALDFTPTNAAPPVNDANLESLVDRSRVTTGGELVSPASDLIATAKELGKLDALRDRVAAVAVAEHSQQHRSQLAMLALINIAADRIAEARQSLDELATVVIAGDSVSFSERWPETLAIWEAAQHTGTREPARDMALHINVNQVQKRLPSGHEAWDQQMRALASRVLYFELLEREPALREKGTDSFNGQWPLANWVPTSRETASTRGQGYPQPHWAMSAPATIENFASHHDDYLFYRIPLRGDFDVECDVTEFGYREMNLWVAGRWTGPAYTLSHVDVGDIRTEQRLLLDLPLHKPDAWIHYRAVVRDGVCTTYANGREIHRRPLEAEYDPWLAIRSFDTTNGAVRNLRITGTPQIPVEVRLTANADLPGWLPTGEGHGVGRNLKWQQLGDLESGGGIRGTRSPSLPGSHWQTLIRYHRPMVEDGTIEYEFYYLEGEMHVHPALDRLAFMLQPDGVRVHWITDDQYDRTELAPDNLFDEPANRRGAEAIPLKANEWNRLQLSLAGDIVSLRLNDEPIFDRTLEPTNQRTFGLFHYADRTEALVRNVVWRGDWPRELPPATEQELAGEGTDFLDESLRELTEVFHHDFAKDGLPSKHFRRVAGEASHFDAQPDGLHVTRPGIWGHNYSTIAPNLGVQGDFDIVASFERFEPQPAHVGCVSAIFLHALLDNDRSNECFVYRKHQWYLAEPRPVVFGAYGTRETGDIRLEKSPYTTVEATSGRLRLARRGDTVYYLFAENDSPVFRLFGTQKTTADDLLSVGLTTETYYERLTSVVWKSLTVRANRLTGPEKSPVFKALANQLTGEVPPAALDFDGRTQHVTIPSIRYDGSHPITLEAFVTPDELRNTIMGDTQSAGIALNIARQTYTLIASYGANYGRAKADSSAFRLLRVHVAGTFDGRILNVFVDGKLEKTGRLNGQFKISGFPMTIGASPSPDEPGIDQPFDGVIDEVRISKTIRYTEDFDVPTVLEADENTMALFRFDEGQGQTLADSSGNKNHGEMRGAQWVTGAAIRERAALGLAEFGRVAVPALIEALRQDDAEVKLAAIAALVTIGPDASSAVPALKQLTDHADDRVRTAASRAIPLIEAKGAF